MRSFDFGEIIRGHTYTRKVYSTKIEKGASLVSGGSLFDQLSKLYSILHILPLDNDIIGVEVKLPDNPNPRYRESWQDTVLKKSNIKMLSLNMDNLVPHLTTTILATPLWMRDFSVSDGERVVVKPRIPTLSSEYEFG